MSTPPPMVAPSPSLRFEALRGVMPLGAVFGGLTVLGCAAVGLAGLDRLGLTPCFFRLATGLPCPTCGSTRAFGRLFHLDLAGAFLMNPLAAAAALGLVLWGVADLALLPGGRALRARVAPALHNPTRVAVVALLFLNWAFLLLVGR